MDVQDIHLKTIDKQISEINSLIQSANDESVLRSYQQALNNLIEAKAKILSRTSSKTITNKTNINIQSHEIQNKEPIFNINQFSSQPNIIENLDKSDDSIASFTLNSNIIINLYKEYDGDIKKFIHALNAKAIEIFANNANFVKFIKKRCYIQLRIKCTFFHEKPYLLSSDISHAKPTFYTKNLKIRDNVAQSLDDVLPILNRQADEIYNQIIAFENNGSDWRFLELISYKIRTFKYETYFNTCKGFIPTPDWLKNRKAVINIRNTDNNCLIKCIYREFHIDTKNRNNSQDIPLDKVYSFFKSNNIDISMFESKEYNPAVIAKFEHVNNIGINIFKLGNNGPEETEQMYTSIHLGKPDIKIINLGYLESDSNTHFVLIRKVNCIVNNKYNRNNPYVCPICLMHISSKDYYYKHINKYHTVNDRPIIKLPKDPTIKFDITKKKYMIKTQKYPFVVYADFEATNIKSDDGVIRQYPNSYLLFSPDLLDLGVINGCIYYSYNPDPEELMNDFVRDLDKLHTQHCYKMQSHPKVPDIGEELMLIHKDKKQCDNCGVKFDNNNPKVRHHDHITGEFIGTWCRRCNFNESRKNFKTTVVFHNFRGYDSHFIIKYAIKTLDKLYREEFNINKLPQFSISKSSEKFSCIQYAYFRFIDSYLHLSNDLDNLVELMKKSDQTCKLVYCDKLNIPECLRSKGVYPYKWMDNYDKFNATSLPPIDDFYNDIKNQPCSEQDYKHAVSVWNELKCKTFKDYHQAYLMSDVFLLADVFTNYRKICMNTYGLDPANFVTAPSFTYTNWLKFSNISIETLTNLEMYNFFSNAKRGGMCSIGEICYANVYNKDNECIIGLDMNALYPTSMLFPLPIGDYQWVSIEEGMKALEDYDFNKFYDATYKYGYYFEVDISVPQEIHDYLSPYPLFPERINDKLIATLTDKKNYITYIANLKLGLMLGYRIDRVSRVLRFRQEPIMKDYILHLANERKKYPKGTFFNEYYKLLANSLFGKTCENPENYRKFKFAVGNKAVTRLINTTNIKNIHILDKINNVILSEIMQSTVNYDKPLPIGVTILEISKWYMQFFYYNILKPYYKERMKFIYTDTDSLVIWLNTKSFKDDIKDPWFDGWFEDDSNKGMPGVMKIEKDNIVLFEAYAPKHYRYIRYINGKFSCDEAFKGVPKGYRPKLTDDDIKRYISGEQVESIKTFNINKIASKKHEIHVFNQSKTISDIDDKRYHIPGSYETLAHGHYKCPK